MSHKVEFGSLTIEVEIKPNEGFYRFIGDVDETFQHQQVPIVNRAVLYLNLAEVNHFNSVGIREWIHFIRQASLNSTPIFRECSVNFIDQINMIPDTLGKGMVESFYAPYYCTCGKEINKLIHIDQFRANLLQMEAPSFPCDCGRTLEFDAIEESYFQFVQMLPRVG